MELTENYLDNDSMLHLAHWEQIRFRSTCKAEVHEQFQGCDMQVELKYRKTGCKRACWKIIAVQLLGQTALDKDGSGRLDYKRQQNSKLTKKGDSLDVCKEIDG